MTDTNGKPNKESMAQGIGNIITGFFGGMGGCAMIGQSMININNGALKRLSGISAAIFLASFILFLSKWIELIPLAALIGVMFVVAEKAFEWGSLRLFGKIPKLDARASFRLRPHAPGIAVYFCIQDSGYFWSSRRKRFTARARVGKRFTHTRKNQRSGQYEQSCEVDVCRCRPFEDCIGRRGGC